MKKIFLSLIVVALAGCQTDYAPPVVTSEMVSGRKGKHVVLAQAQEGRRLFAGRCIECHTLPVIWHYNAQEWPGIVDSMAHRASLKPAEREAIVAYILAVRAQK